MDGVAAGQIAMESVPDIVYIHNDPSDRTVPLNGYCLTNRSLQESSGCLE
jgi:hypothetical protein